MNIAIIGTGNMWPGLGILLAAAQHKITFGSRQPSTARAAATKLGGAAQGGSIREALEHGEVVIMASAEQVL
jgi:predicted dinucleotide-binding enzyme